MEPLTDDITAGSTGALSGRLQDLVERFLTDDRMDFLKENARLLDEYFQSAFMNSRVGPRMEISRNPYAIIALGGYGRSEQCIHSDIDLLVLFEKKVPPQADALIREMIYPLWDIGMEVGYATRSLKECLQLAADNYDILTPILDARFICGMSPLFSALVHKLHRGVIERKASKIIQWLVEKNRERHVHFGDSAYLLEPNLKEGQGGLRDYHTILWIARIKHQLKTPRDLEYLGQLSHEEYRELRKALGFIWRVRNWLHHQSGRKRDQLRFPDQLALAKALKYDEVAGQQPVERFMGDLHASMASVKQQHLIYLHENWLEKLHRRKRSSRKKPREDRLEITARNRLNFKRPEAIANCPELLMRVFEESARLKLPLSLEAKRLVREFSHLVDDAYRSDPKMVGAFERILVAPAAPINLLDEMLHTGFLSQFIPEFAGLVNRIQYDEYHLYPVGRHSLRAVQTLKEFAISASEETPALYRRVYRELHRKKLLLWAVLLHDIGKGDVETGHAERGEVIVREILARHGYAQTEVDLVAYLVRDHLFLIETATRRDIQDEETAIYCAVRIKTAQRLKMLYLLTMADSMATGPAAWSEWTGHLLRELFLKTLNVIENGELASAEAIAIVDRKRLEVAAVVSRKTDGVDGDALLKAMSPRYLLTTPADAIFQHVDLFARLQAPAEFVWQVEPSEDEATRTVTICAADRPGLISKIAGVFTLNNINILDVQVYTWKNQVALDIFTVTPPPDPIFEAEKWQKTHDQLSAALSGELKLGPALEKRLSAMQPPGPKGLIRPDSVKVDNTTSSFFTIVEVYTYDFPGLLYAVTDAIYRCGLNIWVAKIATKVDQVVDVFYVRDDNGEKVDAPEEVQKIERAVLERLPELDATG